MTSVNKYIIFILLFAMSGVANAHGEEVILINLWIIIAAHVIALVVQLYFFDYKTIFFYIAVTLILLFVFWCMEIIVFGSGYINILFYIRFYLILLILPLVCVYLFQFKFRKKIMHNEKDHNSSIGKLPIHSKISLQELAEFEQINSECPLSDEELAHQSIEFGDNVNNHGS